MTKTDKKSKILHKGGFTLVETLVAIAILLTGLTAAFAVAQFGLSSTTSVKDRITVIFLAQEAIETIRNVKDTNLLLQNEDANQGGNPPYDPSWLDGIPSECFNSGFDFNFNPDEPSAIEFVCDPDNPPPPLWINDDGIYTHVSGGTQSKFTRTITIDDDVVGTTPEHEQAIVTVNITWPAGSYSINETISNWFAP